MRQGTPGYSFHIFCVLMSDAYASFTFDIGWFHFSASMSFISKARTAHQTRQGVPSAHPRMYLCCRSVLLPCYCPWAVTSRSLAVIDICISFRFSPYGPAVSEFSVEFAVSCQPKTLQTNHHHFRNFIWCFLDPKP